MARSIFGKAHLKFTYLILGGILMESDFKIYPASLDPFDYWGQVKRTINGVPVSDFQIKLIVEAIENALELKDRGADSLLDIGCGNGALSRLLFNKLSSFYGVDYSDFLISVAKRDFEIAPHYFFHAADALEYLNSEPYPLRYNIMLCYGCFSYFSDAPRVLRVLYDRFLNIERVFIGNLPDRDRAYHFYQEKIPCATEMIDPESKIGIWRSKEEFEAIAREANWKCEFSSMPDNFYANHYRYDVTLTRN